MYIKDLCLKKSLLYYILFDIGTVNYVSETRISFLKLLAYCGPKPADNIMFTLLTRARL